MEKLESREHDFSSKLRQKSVVKRLRDYILWHRDLTPNPMSLKPPEIGPVSINLDLTQACNFSCPHCVDSTIINTGPSLKQEDIKRTIGTLQESGLLSVILLGGGEPTLYRNFKEIVKDIKNRRLQIGIVTNGSRLDKITEVMELLGGKDWVRISIDGAREETFKALHRPKIEVTLDGILRKAKGVKEMNPNVSLGYSFVIVWEGAEVNGKKISPNVDEMAESVKLARKYSFDYVSFKPCLVRLEDSQKESLLDNVDKNKEEEIVEQIKINLQKAKEVADDQIKVLESVNLKAMLNGETDRIKKQPRRCHMQFFRTVVSPSGIFHCPAFRGVEKARIADKDGYVTKVEFGESLRRTATSLLTFDAEEECKVIGCFYHDTNWWLENFIHSGRDIHEIQTIEDDNFFL